MKDPQHIIIYHINNNPAGKDTIAKLNEEFVVLENEGAERVSLAGWQLSDETGTGKRRHVYTFPESFSLAPREKAYVHTGAGKDSLETGDTPRWRLYWGRSAFVWNNEGDTATLTNAKGDKIDSLQIVPLKAR